MSDLRIIKRYPNRRLYDFGQSRYVTLEDVRKLVMDRVDFIVKDHRTEADITSRILLLVMVEEEAAASEPILGTDILIRLIRSRTFRARLSKQIEEGGGV